VTVFDRYVARNVLLSSLVILLVLLSLDALFTAIRELQRGDGLRALTLIAWRMPISAYRYLPVAVLLGGVVGLGTLAMHNELVVARAAGASIWRIYLSVLHAGIPLALGLALIGEFAVPASAVEMQRAKYGGIDSAVARQIGAGLWVRDGERVIRVGGVIDETTLRDVAIYTVHENGLGDIRFASRAQFDGTRWELFEVEQIRLSSTSIERASVEREDVERLFDLAVLSTLSVDARWLPIRDLRDNLRYLADNGLQDATLAHAFWRKIATPVSVLVMLLLAVPMVFGSARDASIGQRIFVASLAGLGYMLLNNVLVNVGQLNGTPASFNTLAALGVFAVFAAVLLRRCDNNIA